MNLSVGSRYSYNSSTSDLTQDGFTESDVDIHIDASAYFGNFNVGINIVPIRGLQYQGISYNREMAVNSIYAYYRYRHFQFGLQWQNPLTGKAFLTQTYNLSKVHPGYNDYYIKDFNNMVLISVQYRFGIGNVYKKPNIFTQKASTDEILRAF